MPTFVIKGNCFFCKAETERSLEIIQLYSREKPEESFMDMRPIITRDGREPLWGCETELCHARLAGMVIRMATSEYEKSVLAEPYKDFPAPYKFVAILSDKKEITGTIRLAPDDLSQN